MDAWRLAGDGVSFFYLWSAAGEADIQIAFSDGFTPFGGWVFFDLAIAALSDVGGGSACAFRMGS